jgi:hypothetical protein
LALWAVPARIVVGVGHYRYSLHPSFFTRGLDAASCIAPT